MPPLEVIREGVVPYGEALERQRRLHAERVAGRRSDVLLLLSHPPVVTLGRGAHAENLLLSPEAMRARGVEIHETDRGGDVTYHGPGQLVGYPILDLRAHRMAPREFLRFLEETLIELLAEFGVAGTRVPGLTGVWVGGEKIAAIGVRIARGVSMHGFALNVSTDPAEFALIVPCGIRDRGVTSLERVLGRPVGIDEVAVTYAPIFLRTLERRIETP